MIEHHVAQGSAAWLQLRLGIPTASDFKRIVTPKGAFSKQSRAYAIYLVTEICLNRSLDSLENLQWVDHGKANEADAIAMYEFTEQVKTRQVGFVTTDDGRYGCSPDALIVGQPGAVEAKCPAPHTHMGYMLDGFGDDYVPQVQGQMLICELEFVERFSFHPEMPRVLNRTYRDGPYIRLLRDALDEFCDMKDELLHRARAEGFYLERDQVGTPVDEAYRESLGQWMDSDPLNPMMAG